jgi:hypothetical protein
VTAKFEPKLRRACKGVAWNSTNTARVGVGLELNRSSSGVLVWDITRGAQSEAIFHSPKLTAGVQALQWLPDQPDLLALGTTRKTVAVVDVRDNSGATAQVQFLAHMKHVSGLVFSPHRPNIFATYATATQPDSGHVKIWDLRRIQKCDVDASGFSQGSGALPLCTLKCSPSLTQASWSPWRAGELATVADDERFISLWDVSGAVDESMGAFVSAPVPVGDGAGAGAADWESVHCIRRRFVRDPIVSIAWQPRPAARTGATALEGRCGSALADNGAHLLTVSNVGRIEHINVHDSMPLALSATSQLAFGFNNWLCAGNPRLSKAGAKVGARADPAAGGSAVGAGIGAADNTGDVHALPMDGGRKAAGVAAIAKHAAAQGAGIGVVKGGATLLSVLASQDIGRIMVSRALAGYSVAPLDNLRILSSAMEALPPALGGAEFGGNTASRTQRIGAPGLRHGSVRIARGQLRQLTEMWNWVERVECLASDGHVGGGTAQGADAALLANGVGVQSLLGFERQRGGQYPAQRPKPRRSGDSGTSQSQHPVLGCPLYTSPGRSLALQLCGWSTLENEGEVSPWQDRESGDLSEGGGSLEEAVAQLGRRGQFERAAAISIFHGDLERAVVALQEGSDSMERELREDEGEATRFAAGLRARQEVGGGEGSDGEHSNHDGAQGQEYGGGHSSHAALLQQKAQRAELLQLSAMAVAGFSSFSSTSAPLERHSGASVDSSSVPGRMQQLWSRMAQQLLSKPYMNGNGQTAFLRAALSFLALLANGTGVADDGTKSKFSDGGGRGARQPSLYGSAAARRPSGVGSSTASPGWRGSGASADAADMRLPFESVLQLVAEADGAQDGTLLPLADRTAFACRFLSDQHLRQFVEHSLRNAEQNADLQGMLLAGITNRGVLLLQKYLDLTSDIQTVALVAAHIGHDRTPIAPGATSVSPAAAIKGEEQSALLLEGWINSYRELLDRWRLWHQRAQFDVERARLRQMAKERQRVADSFLATPETAQQGQEHAVGASALGSGAPKQRLTAQQLSAANRAGAVQPSNPGPVVPAQLFVRCQFCNKSLDLTTLMQEVNKKTQSSVGRSAKQSATSHKSVISRCPSCSNSLPICALCLMPFGCLNPQMEQQVQAMLLRQQEQPLLRLSAEKLARDVDAGGGGAAAAMAITGLARSEGAGTGELSSAQTASKHGSFQAQQLQATLGKGSERDTQPLSKELAAAKQQDQHLQQKGKVGVGRETDQRAGGAKIGDERKQGQDPKGSGHDVDQKSTPKALAAEVKQGLAEDRGMAADEDRKEQDPSKQRYSRGSAGAQFRDKKSKVAVDQEKHEQKLKQEQAAESKILRAARIPYDEWFSWCMSCRHGGHVHHLAMWFAKHDECPVRRPSSHPRAAYVQSGLLSHPPPLPHSRLPGIGLQLQVPPAGRRCVDQRGPV